MIYFLRSIFARRRSIIEADVLRTLANMLPVMAWTARADGYIDWYNARWYQYTGTTFEQMKGWGWQSVHDAKELLTVMDKWEHSIASGERFEMICPLRGSNGRFRYFMTRVEPMKDSDGNILRWFGTNTDIEHEHRDNLQSGNMVKALNDRLDRLEHGRGGGECSTKTT